MGLSCSESFLGADLMLGGGSELLEEHVPQNGMEQKAHILLNVFNLLLSP